MHDPENLLPSRCDPNRLLPLAMSTVRGWPALLLGRSSFRVCFSQQPWRSFNGANCLPFLNQHEFNTKIFA